MNLPYENSTCPTKAGRPYSKDIKSKQCQSAKLAKRADVWSLGLLILQFEITALRLGQMSNAFISEMRAFTEIRCYTQEWTSECDRELQNIVDQVFNKLYEKVKSIAEISLISNFKSLIESAFDKCEKRPSSHYFASRLVEIFYSIDMKLVPEKETVKHEGEGLSWMGTIQSWFEAGCCSRRVKTEPELQFLI